MMTVQFHGIGQILGEERAEMVVWRAEDSNFQSTRSCRKSSEKAKNISSSLFRQVLKRPLAARKNNCKGNPAASL